MKHTIFFVYIFLIINAFFIYGQSDQQREQIRQELRRQERINKEFKRFQSVRTAPIDLPFNKLSKADKQSVAPDETLKSKYNEFLRLPGAEITKILNVSCFEIGDVKLSDRCKSSIPGYGAFYSFNNKKHLFWHSSNIQLNKDQLVVAGFLTMGIIVSLGKVDIEKFSLQSDGIKFLAAFAPAEIKSEAEKQLEKFQGGMEMNGYIYKQAEKVIENNVYALRSISYRSKVSTASHDQRDDIIVLFKVVQRKENGDVVLIWRKMQSKDAPKLRER